MSREAQRERWRSYLSSRACSLAVSAIIASSVAGRVSVGKRGKSLVSCGVGVSAIVRRSRLECHIIVWYFVPMKKKVTYQLDGEVLQAVRQAVDSGKARTMSEFVQNALEFHLAELRRAAIRENIRDACADPLFREDVREVQAAYESTANDGMKDR